MKNKLLALVVGLVINQSVEAADVKILPIAQQDVPIEHKVVELQITFAPPPTVEVKKQRKLMATKAGKAVCSGSFIGPSGFILTARHCVQGASEVDVITEDRQVYSATILATSRTQDLAIIQIGRSNTPFFKLAEKCSKGERVTIIGSPLGLTGLLTAGIVSKLAGDKVFLDCTAVPGNSGGPVINENGELVGVVSAMVVVILGPAHITVVQSVDSVKFFFYEMMAGRYNTNAAN